MKRIAILSLGAVVTFACSSDYSIWIPRSKSADPLYRFVKNGKAGYIDGKGRVVIPPKFTAFGNSGSAFQNGLLEVEGSDGVYADRSGEVVIDKNLYRGWDFSEGLAVAMRKGERLWGYINTSGEFAIPPRFATGGGNYVWSFSDGLAKIQVNGKFGFIDHSGTFVIQPEWLDADDFNDGMSRVVTEGPCVYVPDGPCGFANLRSVGGTRQEVVTSCKFTYIDRKGRVLTRGDSIKRGAFRKA